MRRFILLSLAMLLSAASVSAEAVPLASGQELAKSNARFAWDLYGKLRGGDGNLFFSPHSVASALQMAREGARGETAAQMDAVLHLKAVKDLGASYADLGVALRAPTFQVGDGKKAKQVPAYEMAVANRLWGQHGFTFERDFVASLAKEYKAPLARLDFADSDNARKVINDWVAKQTKDKIEDIVPKGMPPPATRLVLANAIYFKAPWQDSFSKGATKDRDFTRANGTKVKTPLMHNIDSFGYAEVDGVQILEIPYKKRKASMVIILPRAHDGLPAVEDKLVGGALEGWLEKATWRRVDLKLPKFKFTWAKELVPTLRALGMRDATDLRTADFSGITKQDRLSIGAVVHKAFIAVDEEGTEAAAATVVMWLTGAARPPAKPVSFVADRPFAFVIRHRPTKSILFAGRYTKP